MCARAVGRLVDACLPKRPSRFWREFTQEPWDGSAPLSKSLQAEASAVKEGQFENLEAQPPTHTIFLPVPVGLAVEILAPKDCSNDEAILNPTRQHEAANAR